MIFERFLKHFCSISKFTPKIAIVNLTFCSSIRIHENLRLIFQNSQVSKIQDHQKYLQCELFQILDFFFLQHGFYIHTDDPKVQNIKIVQIYVYPKQNLILKLLAGPKYIGVTMVGIGFS